MRYSRVTPPHGVSSYLAFMISLFAIIVVLPATGEVFAQQAPAENQSPPPTSAPNQALVGPTLDKLSADVQALSQQIKQVSEAVARRPGALDRNVAITLFIVLAVCLLGALLYGSGGAIGRQQKKKTTWRLCGYLTGFGSSSARCSSRSWFWLSP
jgi:hypothetical protein